MSSDLEFLNSLPTTTSAPSAPVSIESLEAEQAKLSKLLSSLSTSTDGELEGLDEAGVQEMLSKIEQAEAVTGGLETRLDSLLGTLDGLLSSMDK